MKIKNLYENIVVDKDNMTTGLKKMTENDYFVVGVTLGLVLRIALLY